MAVQHGLQVHSFQNSARRVVRERLANVSTPQSQIKSLFLDGPAGRLEALLNVGSASPTHAVVVCHPHPMFGGTLHNKVVFHAAKGLHGFGFPVLRFNFRGTGLSQGEHDNGRGEVDDVRAALDWLAREFSVPLVFCGFSFGAAVGLRAAVDDARVAGLIGLGTPVMPVDDRSYDLDFLRGCTKPKLFCSGDRDQYGPRSKLEALVASLPEPRQLTLISGADHFFEGRLSEMRTVIEEWVRTQILV
jgi:alpha/beta superfamily hydrolase